jgi:hypothetical protein
LIAFAVYYHGYRKEAEILASQKQAQLDAINQKAAVERKAFQQKLANEARAEAKRKAEAIAEKARIEEAEQKEFENLSRELVRVTTLRDEDTQKLFDLTMSQRDEQDLTKRAKTRIETLNDEKKFLDNYIPIAKESRDNLAAFLKKVEETKVAVEAAAKAAKQQQK